MIRDTAPLAALLDSVRRFAREVLMPAVQQVMIPRNMVRAAKAGT